MQGVMEETEQNARFPPESSKLYTTETSLQRQLTTVPPSHCAHCCVSESSRNRGKTSWVGQEQVSFGQPESGTK